MSDKNYNELDIAIVGMAGRFPGADDVDSFWENIRNGHSAVQKYTDDQLRKAGVPEKDLNNPDYVKVGIPFEGVAQFDAEFFGYTPKDAAQLDPQQRVFLQTCWHALEHAGFDQATRSQTGIFAGCGVPAYLLQNLLSNQQEQDITSLLALTNGNDKDSLATRVSYELDLKGPSVTVQTACSTSLVAVHMACRSLQSYECNAAIAGGVWLNLNSEQGYHAPSGGSFSASGKLSAFSEQADGILIGSGSAAVVLKRIDEAISDGDHILGVIKGSAINNDGKDKVGYTAPSVNGQATAILTALEFADIEPESIGYIEAHGTGTVLGDPIEIAALTQAYQSEQEQFCAIGSVKANIGHLDAAAGITGLIKAIQVLRHKELPPSLNSQPLNSKINFAQSPFYVPTELTPWHSNGVRRAAVSSLGMGGTNAHVILEEYVNEVELTDSDPTPPWHILPVSAVNTEVLDLQKKALSDVLTNSPESIAKVAAQLQHKRLPLIMRQALVVGDSEQAINSLNRENLGNKVQQVNVALMFSGQGSQYVTMAQPLLRYVPAFKAAFDEVLALFPQHLQTELQCVFTPKENQLLEANQLLNKTRITQPALFIVGYSMAKCYQEHGVNISAMLGHSIGEYVAACLAGVMSPSVAVKLVSARGEALQSMAPGAMLSVSSDEQSLIKYLNEDLDIAALNSPNNTVISGKRDAIKTLQKTLGLADVSCTRLHVSHAFHSHLTEDVLAEFSLVLAEVELNVPTSPFISNVTGTWITSEQATAKQYWLDHIRKPVNFVAGVTTLSEQCTILIEAGPGDTLAKLAKQVIQKNANTEVVILSSIAHVRDLKEPIPPFIKTLAQLWQHGVEVNWENVTSSPRAQVPILPAYPFSTTEYWVDKTQAAQISDNVLTSGPQLLEPVWQQKQHVHNGTSLDGKYIVLINTDIEMCEVFQQVLSQAGAIVNIVHDGEEFSKHGDHQYSVNCSDVDSLEQLSSHINTIDHVIDCRLLTHISTKYNDTGYSLLLPVVQWVNKLATARFSVLATELFSVLGDESLCPLKSTVLGLTRVMGLENSQSYCQLIELSYSSASNPNDKLMKNILSGLTNKDVSEQAFRGIQSFTLTQKIVEIDKTDHEIEIKSDEFKPQVTLITGGLGGVGLVLAELLVNQGHSLVLQTRTEFPESSQWSQLLQGSNKDLEEKQKAQLAKLNTLHSKLHSDAKIYVMKADVLDNEDFTVALTKAQNEVGVITQVIHAAGLPGGGLISQMSVTQAQTSMAAKVQGTANLLAIFSEHQLERMVLCSSLASVLGAFGQSDYCAGNSYLDCIAAQTHSFPVQSLNWDAWSDIGMASQHSIGGEFGITAIAGQQLFWDAISSAAPQLYASSLSWEERIITIEQLSQELVLKNSPAKFKPGHGRPDIDTEYEAPDSELEHKLVELWAQSLGFEKIGIFDSLFELGGDSLIAIQMVAKVKQQFSIELEPALFFEDPSIDNLAFLIEERLLNSSEAV